jgi:signal transduction histidine kinase
VFFPRCATTIRIFDPETTKLEVLASANLDEQADLTEPRQTEPREWLISRDVAELNSPRIIRNVQNEPRFWHADFCRSNGLVSYLGLPLMVQAAPVGTISLYTRTERNFTEEELSFFTALAGQAAVALQNARLRQEVHAGHAQLRELSQRLLTVQETDRRHLARELHDEIGQVLTGLKLTLEMTDWLPFREASTKLTRAESIVDDLIKRIRGLSLDLRPSMLDDLGLLPTLIWYVQRYSATTGVHVEFRHNGLQSRRFASQVETAAYRIIQEALTNIARHAKITQASVNVWCISDSLFLEIQDEGAGFDPEAAQAHGNTNGLTGMRERAILLSGELSIDSSPGAGTCVTAQLPLASFDGDVESNGEDKHRLGRRSPDRS